MWYVVQVLVFSWCYYYYEDSQRLSSPVGSRCGTSNVRIIDTLGGRLTDTMRDPTAYLDSQHTANASTAEMLLRRDY